MVNVVAHCLLRCRIVHVLSKRSLMTCNLFSVEAGVGGEVIRSALESYVSLSSNKYNVLVRPWWLAQLFS